jgi:hypothetical protein
MPLRQRSSKMGVMDISHELSMKTHAFVRKPRTRAVVFITGFYSKKKLLQESRRGDVKMKIGNQLHYRRWFTVAR